MFFANKISNQLKEIAKKLYLIIQIINKIIMNMNLNIIARKSKLVDGSLYIVGGLTIWYLKNRKKLMFG